MGSRGAFEDVNKGNFTFKEGGQQYYSVGNVDGVKVLVKGEKGSVKAPEYSHTENRAYAVIQDGRLKHVAFYGENHRQTVCLDFLHRHCGIVPHKHFNLNHDDNGIPITAEEAELANKIRRRFNLR